jgi:hypothetical protein
VAAADDAARRLEADGRARDAERALTSELQQRLAALQAEEAAVAEAEGAAEAAEAAEATAGRGGRAGEWQGAEADTIAAAEEALRAADADAVALLQQAARETWLRGEAGTREAELAARARAVLGELAGTAESLQATSEAALQVVKAAAARNAAATAAAMGAAAAAAAVGCALWDVKRLLLRVQQQAADETFFGTAAASGGSDEESAAAAPAAAPASAARRKPRKSFAPKGMQRPSIAVTPRPDSPQRGGTPSGAAQLQSVVDRPRQRPLRRCTTAVHLAAAAALSGPMLGTLADAFARCELAAGGAAGVGGDSGFGSGAGSSVCAAHSLRVLEALLRRVAAPAPLDLARRCAPLAPLAPYALLTARSLTHSHNHEALTAPMGTPQRVVERRGRQRALAARAGSAWRGERPGGGCGARGSAAALLSLGAGARRPAGRGADARACGGGGRPAPGAAAVAARAWWGARAAGGGGAGGGGDARGGRCGRERRGAVATASGRGGRTPRSAAPPRHQPQPRPQPRPWGAGGGGGACPRCHKGGGGGTAVHASRVGVGVGVGVARRGRAHSSALGRAGGAGGCGVRRRGAGKGKGGGY